MTKILGVDITPNDKSLEFSKISDVASGNIIGRVSEGTGSMETLNPSTVRTLLDVPVTGHTHPSILASTITDGDTTHAPDGNSVYDALASKINTSEKASVNGVATLDSSGLVPTTQLPSYVDDVLEYNTLSVFPVTGTTGKIYVDLSTNKTYRWSGSAYIYITSGAVDSVAGKTGVVSLVKADVGLENVDNTADSNKPVVTTTVNGLMSSTDKVKLDAISGTNTGDQTNITGNAATATKLATARTISGTSFDGSAPITIDHTGLSSIGTNTHAQIDTALTRLTNTSGTNTGDQNLQSIIATTITDGDTTHAPDGNSVYDALALKSDTTHTHPSILTTTITDGDTTHAPDGNSVYDALALKSDTTHTHPSILTTAITDGDTTHAPDGNSVYDALALKSDVTHTHEIPNMYSQIFYNVRR